MSEKGVDKLRRLAARKQDKRKGFMPQGGLGRDELPQGFGTAGSADIQQFEQPSADGISRRDFLTASTAAMMAAMAVTPQFTSEGSMGLPGGIAGIPERQSIIISAPSGDPLDGSGTFTGLTWHHDGYTDSVSGKNILLGSWKNNVLQVGFADNASFIAGAGAVTLGATGVSVVIGEASENHYKFIADTDGLELGYTELTIGGTTTPNRQANKTDYAVAESGGTGTATNLIGVIGGNGNTGYINVRSNPAFSNGGWAQYNQPGSNQQGSLHYGNYGTFYATALTTTPSTLMSDTIEGNSLGTDGQLEYHFEITDRNGSGATRNHTLVCTFGAMTFTRTFSVAATGGARARLFVDWYIRNLASESVQSHMLVIRYRDTTALGTFAAFTSNENVQDAGADDTTSDISVSVTLATNNNTTTQEAYGMYARLGPYYA